jgi:hypothetical protein
MAEKLSKESVEYEHPAAKSDHCGICAHYILPHPKESGSCEIVARAIRAEDWCNRFRHSRARTMTNG